MTTEIPLAPATDPAVAPVPAPATAAPGSYSIAESTLQNAYAAEVAAGRMSQADADRLMAADLGFSPDDNPVGAYLRELDKAAEKAAQADESEAAKFLREFGIKPAAPQEYQLPPLAENDHTPIEDVVTADSQIRGWLSEAHLPKELGSTLAATAVEFAGTWATMTEPSRALHAASVEADLRRVWRGEYDQKIAGARQLVRELEAKQPGLVEMLERSGAGNHPMVIAQLAQHAELLATRHNAVATP